MPGCLRGDVGPDRVAGLAEQQRTVRVGDHRLACEDPRASRAGLDFDAVNAVGFDLGMRHVVEVYPAASLRGWGLRHRGYKRPSTPDVLAATADDLLAAAPWLDCGPHEETIRRSHDAFDAVIAALTARAASRGQTCPPGGDDLAAAATEGWIAIPASPISELL